MTATRQAVALDWVEQWQAFRAGKPGGVLKELEAPHGRVRIHGRRDDRHGYAATFVRGDDGPVVPLGAGDYSTCADACAGVLKGRDPVWDHAKRPPPAVLVGRRRRTFLPVDGRSVVGALKFFGGVVLLGVHRGTWTFLFHDDKRSEWLRPVSRTFDLDTWLRDHPAPSPRAEPAPDPSPAGAASSAATSSASETPAPQPTPPPPPTPPPSSPPTPAREQPSPATAAERRRQAQAAQRDAELREQHEHAARKDADLRARQRRVVLGADDDPGEGPSDSDAVRACLLRLPDRAPAGQPQLIIDWFVTLLIAVGEAGYFGDLSGRKADIAATLSRVLGKPVCAKMLGLALTILLRMNSCLVELANNKWWTVKLSGLANRTSARHQALLAETGDGFQLRPVKCVFRGRQPVRWEIPAHVLAGAVARPDADSGPARQPAEGPRGAPVVETPEGPETSDTGGSTSRPGDVGRGVEDVDLRHQLTVAHGLAKLAHERHQEQRAAWQREKAELTARVDEAEKLAQATTAELATLRGLHDDLLAKFTALQQTADASAALIERLEQKTAALVASMEQQEVQARDVEELRRRHLVLAAERDQLAAEVARLARRPDEQADLAGTATTDVLAENLPSDAPRADADPPAGSVPDATAVIVTCVVWTTTALTFTVARRASAQRIWAQRTAASSTRLPSRHPGIRFPRIASSASTRARDAQGPRGPPASSA